MATTIIAVTEKTRADALAIGEFLGHNGARCVRGPRRLGKQQHCRLVAGAAWQQATQKFPPAARGRRESAHHTIKHSGLKRIQPVWPEGREKLRVVFSSK